jgi:thioredoxin-like negative regulator of GroEL
LPAARALQQFVDKTAEPSPAAVDALLAAAESLCRTGEYELAAEICQPLLGAESRRVREGAFRGLIAAKPAESMAMIIAALAGEEAWKRVVAADWVADLREPAQIQAIAAAIPTCPPKARLPL